MGIFKPNAVFDGITKIDFEFLKSHQIEGILLDIDNTLIDISRELKDDVVDWVMKAKQSAFKVMILSNTNKSYKYIPVSEKLGIDYIIFAKKPCKKGFYDASKHLGIELSKLVMIGDQVLTDVLGANRVGVYSIYVKPINKKEYWYTKIKRPLESLILKLCGY